MKKRILAALVCAAMTLSLVGCGNDDFPVLTSEPTSKTEGTSSKAGTSTAGGTTSVSTGNSDNSSTENSKPEEPTAPATNVLNAQGEKLDFPETPLSDFDYEIQNYIAYIKEYFGSNPDVSFPSEIEGKRVVIYSDFEDHGTIKRLIFPDNFSLFNRSTLRMGSSLESLAFLGSVFGLSGLYFNSPNLKSVYFGGTVPSCSSLKSVFSITPWFKQIDEYEGLVVIDDVLFTGERCQGDIVIPDGVTEIGVNAFNNVESAKLQNVKLPESLKKIGTSAFANTGLVSINIPDSVAQIGSKAFDSTPYLKGLMNDNKLAIDGKWLLDGHGAYGNVNVPNGVTHIANGAFGYGYLQGGAKMQNVTLPDGLLYIGASAFNGASFKTITIPDSVTFADTYALSPLFDIAEYRDSDMVVLGSVAVIGLNYDQKKVITVPDGVKTVSMSFASGQGNTPLASLILPDSICSCGNSILQFSKTVTYKGKTYNTIGENQAAEREALRAAIEGN